MHLVSVRILNFVEGNPKSYLIKIDIERETSAFFFFEKDQGTKCMRL